MKDREERADKEEQEGKFVEFQSMEDLIRDLHDVRGPGTGKPCNNPSCSTCLGDCPWKCNYYGLY